MVTQQQKQLWPPGTTDHTWYTRKRCNCLPVPCCRLTLYCCSVILSAAGSCSCSTATAPLLPHRHSCLLSRGSTDRCENSSEPLPSSRLDSRVPPGDQKGWMRSSGGQGTQALTIVVSQHGSQDVDVFGCCLMDIACDVSMTAAATAVATAADWQVH